MGAIWKVREYIDQPRALRLHKSLILPHYDYCDTVYMTGNKDSLNKLQLLQNSACRTMLFANRDCHISDMHVELDRSLIPSKFQVGPCSKH